MLRSWAAASGGGGGGGARGAVRQLAPWLVRAAAFGVLAGWLRQVARLRLRLWDCAGGPWPVPLLGTVHRILLLGIPNIHRSWLRDARSFGKIYSWAYFHKAMVNIACPEYLRRVLVTHWRSYDRSDIEQAAFGELLGEGLLFVPNDRWGDMRRVYQSGFSDRNILAFRHALVAWSEAFAEGLAQSAGPVDVQEAVQRLTFRAIGHFTLGIDFEDAGRLAELQATTGAGRLGCRHYGELWSRLLEHTQIRFAFGPLQWWRVLKTEAVRAFEQGHALLLGMVDAAIEARLSGARAEDFGGSGDFQDLLCLMVGQKGQRYSRRELRQQAMTFLFAGHDTTTNLIAFCLYLLAERPAALARARADAAITDGPKPFLRCCLLETLRLYPSAPLRLRTACQEDVFAAAAPEACPMLRSPAAVRVAVGTGVGFAINAVHLDPTHWPEPDKFDPDRFAAHAAAHCARALWAAPGHADRDEPLAYLPFGAGPRRCIGERFALLEAEEICAAVLRRCDCRPAPGPRPVDELQLTLRARDGVHLVFERRGAGHLAADAP